MLHLLRELQRKAPVRFSLQGRQRRPGAPGLPRAPAARVHGARGLRLHDDRGGHVLDRHREDPRREDVLLPLLAPAARDPLPRGRRRWGATRSPSVTTATTSSRRSCSTCSSPGKLASMPPKLVADSGDARRHPAARLLRRGGHPRVRRARTAFPILPCDLCGSQEQLQRKQVGRMLDELERRAPGHQGDHARGAAERAARATSSTATCGARSACTRRREDDGRGATREAGVAERTPRAGLSSANPPCYRGAAMRSEGIFQRLSAIGAAAQASVPGRLRVGRDRGARGLGTRRVRRRQGRRGRAPCWRSSAGVVGERSPGGTARVASLWGFVLACALAWSARPLRSRRCASTRHEASPG